jgi:virginiamycin B lyase
MIELLETRYLLSSVVNTFPIPGSDPDNYYGSGHLIAGRNGFVWFADTSDNAIGRIAPSGQITIFPLPIHRIPADDGSGDIVPEDPEPMDIVQAPNGNIWFTESNSDRIGEINARGKIIEFQTPTPDSYPEGLAVGSDGSLWFAEIGNDAIGKITPTGRITEYVFDDLQTDYDGLVEGSDGNIWFLADDSNCDPVIARITPAGAVSSWSLDITQSDGTVVQPDLSSLASGPDGSLWIGTFSYGVERITTSGALTAFALSAGDSVTSIEPGSGGRLWLALAGNDQLGFITTSGAVSTFTLPETDADSDNIDISMSDLIEGPDGVLWFVDLNTPQAGNIDLADLIIASGNSVNVIAGSPQTSTLATFFDFAGAADASNYTATITLDDGTTASGTIAANSAGGFDVSASNSWAIGIDNGVMVTITDSRDPSRTATAWPTITGSAPQATGTGVSVSTTAGQVFSGTFATFTNVALNSLSSYSATIHWGDGYTSDGVVTANAAGGFDVSGTHTYGYAANDSIVTTLWPYPSDYYYNNGPIIGGGVQTGASINGAPSGTATSTIDIAPPILPKPINANAPVPEPIAPIQFQAPIVAIGTDEPLLRLATPIFSPSWLQFAGFPIMTGGLGTGGAVLFTLSINSASRVMTDTTTSFGNVSFNSATVDSLGNSMMVALPNAIGGDMIAVSTIANGANTRTAIHVSARRRSASIGSNGASITAVMQAASHSVAVKSVNSASHSTPVSAAGPALLQAENYLKGVYLTPTLSDASAADPASDSATLFSDPAVDVITTPSAPRIKGDAMTLTAGISSGNGTVQD